MIYFNATFFIQIFNFLCAWWLLRRFLFRPVVSAIQHEKGVDKRLNNNVVAEQVALKKAQSEQHRQWLWYQQEFRKRIPEAVVHRVISVQSFQKIEAPSISSAAQKRDCAVLTDLVIARLSHD